MSAFDKENLENELADISNVEDDDDGEDISTSADLFTISSYGVDNPVEHLVKRLKNENYYIPRFQRAYVWSQNEASKFVESLLLGLPVPGIFLYKESDSSRHLVIDGQQRLKSLLAYFDGTFKERKFRLSGLKSQWDGLTFDDLDEDDRVRLEDAVMHTTIFKQDSPSDNMDSVYEVFERINTGGVKLSPQEIRSCVAQGNLNDLLFKLNEDEKWRGIFGPKSIRLKDIELILRFFSFLNNHEGYLRPAKKFFTDYMTDNKNLSEDDLEKFEQVWTDTISIIVDTLGARPFRPSRALNAALYDSFTVAVGLRVQDQKKITKTGLLAAYEALMEDEEYKKYISSGTSGDDSVNYRFRTAIGIVNKCNDA